MNKDNVIQLPIRNRMLKIKNNLRLRFDLEQRKVITSASIVSILMVVAFLNDRLAVSPEHSARGIASIVTDSSMESAFAKELATSSQSATFATRATPLDQLTYGVLEGKYAMRVYQGRVQEARFVPDESMSPTLVVDRAQFLKQAQSALGIAFTSVSKVGERLENEHKFEQFSLLDKQNQPLAKVELQVDAADRLLALKFMN